MPHNSDQLHEISQKLNYQSINHMLELLLINCNILKEERMNNGWQKRKKYIYHVLQAGTIGIWMKLIGLFSNIRIPYTTIEGFCEFYLQGKGDESYKVDTPQIRGIFGAKPQFKKKKEKKEKSTEKPGVI